MVSVPAVDWCRRCSSSAGFVQCGVATSVWGCAEARVRWHWVCSAHGCAGGGCLLTLQQSNLVSAINSDTFSYYNFDSDNDIGVMSSTDYNTQCKAASECPNGFLAGGSCACACAAGYGGNPCQQCTAGQFSSGGICIPCAANTYSSAGQSACSPCAAGTESLAGAGVCTACAAGS